MSGWMVWSPSSTHTGFLRFSSPNRSSTFPGRQSGRVATESTAMSSRSTTGVNSSAAAPLGRRCWCRPGNRRCSGCHGICPPPGLWPPRFGPGWTGGRRGEVPRAPAEQKMHPPDAQGPIPVGAGHAAVETEFVQLFPELRRQYSFSVCTVSLPFFLYFITPESPCQPGLPFFGCSAASILLR